MVPKLLVRVDWVITLIVMRPKMWTNCRVHSEIPQSTKGVSDMPRPLLLLLGGIVVGRTVQVCSSILPNLQWTIEVMLVQAVDMVV